MRQTCNPFNVTCRVVASWGMLACHRMLNIHQACRGSLYITLNGRFPSAWGDLSPYDGQRVGDMSRAVKKAMHKNKARYTAHSIVS